MYLVVAFAVTILVIVLAWRGIGAARNEQDTPTRRRNARNVRSVRRGSSPPMMTRNSSPRSTVDCAARTRATSRIRFTVGRGSHCPTGEHPSQFNPA